MNKKMKNNHKLHVFSFMLRGHIYLELVQSKCAVIDSVNTFIMSMYIIFVEVEWSCINTKHQHFGFSMTLVFQQTIKLGS
jgi:hypothetical protein